MGDKRNNMNGDRELSDLVINSKGQLCEILDLGSTIFVHVFNSLREDPWVGISFSFNPRFISRSVGW
ncbi:hypothetical protein RCC89_18690 [Cytophagaceae bacterium ABcell3]|nr:hypothetical protein RCC89_18690 [Cytophagaceae bacterium ABcell3]